MSDRGARGGRHHAGADAARAGVDPGRRGVRPVRPQLRFRPRRVARGSRRPTSRAHRRRAPVVPAALAGHGLSPSRRSAARRGGAADAGRTLGAWRAGPARHAVRDAALAEGAKRRAEGTGGVTRTSRSRRSTRRAAPTSTTAPRAPSRPRRRPCRSAWPRSAPALRPSSPGSPRRIRCGPTAGAIAAPCPDPHEIPAELDASATPQARADRAYQIATASFYAGAVGRRGDALPRHRRGSHVAVAAVGRVPRRPRVPAQGHDRRRRRRARSGGAGRRRGRVREGRRGSGVAAARVGGRPRAVHRSAAASGRAAPRGGREAARARRRRVVQRRSRRISLPVPAQRAGRGRAAAPADVAPPIR